MTTRPQREGERHGIDYFFVDRDEFHMTVESGEMLEWAEFAGNLYGTPAGPVEDKIKTGSHVILEIELQGARQVRARFPEAFLVFLKPPSWEVLVERLTGRGTETASVIADRLAAAEHELAAESEFDVAFTNSEIRATADALLEFARSKH